MSTVQTNQTTNQAKATQAGSAISSVFDKLNKGKDADAFASMLSGLKHGMFQGGERARMGKLQRLQEKFAPNSTLLGKQTDIKERQKKLDEEEEDKKAREKKELAIERRNEELKRAEQEQEDLSKMALNMMGSTQSNSPFARLVSAIASSGTGSGNTASSNLSLGTSLEGNAYGGQSAGAGADSVGMASSSTGGSAVNGYAVADATSSEAKAASLMSSISDPDAQIEQDLNNLNQSNLSAVPKSQPESMAERLANMNNDDLRQSLDNLAKAGSVSKLSLQMTNPQTAAAEANNAAAIANMPTSGNKLAALGSSASPSSAPSSVAANSGATASSHVSTESLIKFRQNQQAAEGEIEVKSSQEFLEKTAAAKMSQSGVSSSKTSVSVGTEVSTESALAKKTAAESLEHGLLTKGSELIQRSSHLGAAVQGVTSGAMSAATSKTMATAQAANNFETNLGSERTAYSAGSAQVNRVNALTSITQDSFRAGMSSISGTSGLGSSGSALLASVARSQASQMPSSLSATLSAQNQEEALGLAMGLNDNSLALAENSNAAMQQALASLKQGMGLQPQYVQGYDPRNYMSADSLAVSSVGSGEASADTGDSALDYGQDSTDSTSASAATAASAQAAQNFAQSVANHSNPTANNLASASMTFSSSASENAKELHEKVMQMSARNLKQLSVELTPNNLGKMRIEISLDKANDALSVSLASANPQTRKALEQALPELRDTLANQNIMVDEQVYDLDDAATNTRDHGQGENNAHAGHNADTLQEFFAQRHMTQSLI